MISETALLLETGPSQKKMTPTHQLRSSDHSDVVAWRFLPNADMPVWVFRNFHDLGGSRHQLTHRSGYRVQVGEWIVRSEQIAFVLTDEEFNSVFMELPKNPES